MTVKGKTRTIGTRAARSLNEVNDFIRRIGKLNEQISCIEEQMHDEIVDAQEKCERQAEPLREKRNILTEGVQIYCETHRAVLTDNEKRKFHNFKAGQVEWRNLPPSVSVRSVKDALKSLKENGLLHFIRTKEELDKEAMLKNQTKVAEVKGITIKSGGETFSITPKARREL